MTFTLSFMCCEPLVRNYKIKCVRHDLRLLNLTTSTSTFYYVVIFSGRTTDCHGTSLVYYFHLSSVRLKNEKLLPYSSLFTLLSVLLYFFYFFWGRTERREREGWGWKEETKEKIKFWYFITETFNLKKYLI